MTIKEPIKKALLQFGYQVQRVKNGQIGHDPFEDMRTLADTEGPAILFDVGANRGQSVSTFHAHFPSSVIHAFEPGPSTFELLKNQTGGIPNLHLNNVALGSNCERKTLIESSVDTVSSLLPRGKDFHWGDVTSHTDVDVISIDSYCQSNGITHIDVLKSDTQGFDYEVLKGGLNMLTQHRIHLIFVELLFADLYVGMPSFEEIYLFLKNLGFQLVSFYNISWQDSRLGWLDGLFIDPHWQRPDLFRSNAPLS